MKNFLYSIGALLAAIATSSAAPRDAVEGLEARKRAFDCKDKLVVLVFSKYSSLASSLCSSYIPATTTTEVVVSTSIPTPPTQITETVPLTATITETITVTTPGSPITYIYNAPFPSNTKTILPTPPPMAKRSASPEPIDDKKRSLPPWVRDYASTQIASACSCFSIKPSTSTVTSTSDTVAPTPTITATISSTVTTLTITSTTTVSGPRPTVSTCADYQLLPFNKDYSWLSPSDLTTWSVQTLYSLSLIECCNRCYTTQNCISYRYFGIRSFLIYGCDLYTLPGNGGTSPGPHLLGYNQQCPLGVFKGTRQLNSAPNAPQLAIGPCLDADYLN